MLNFFHSPHGIMILPLIFVLLGQGVVLLGETVLSLPGWAVMGVVDGVMGGAVGLAAVLSIPLPEFFEAWRTDTTTAKSETKTEKTPDLEGDYIKYTNEIVDLVDYIGSCERTLLSTLGRWGGTVGGGKTGADGRGLPVTMRQGTTVVGNRLHPTHRHDGAKKTTVVGGEGASTTALDEQARTTTEQKIDPKRKLLVARGLSKAILKLSKTLTRWGAELLDNIPAEHRKFIQKFDGEEPDGSSKGAAPSGVVSPGSDPDKRLRPLAIAARIRSGVTTLTDIIWQTVDHRPSKVILFAGDRSHIPNDGSFEANQPVRWAAAVELANLVAWSKKAHHEEANKQTLKKKWLSKRKKLVKELSRLIERMEAKHLFAKLRTSKKQQEKHEAAKKKAEEDAAKNPLHGTLNEKMDWEKQNPAHAWENNGWIELLRSFGAKVFNQGEIPKTENEETQLGVDISQAIGVADQDVRRMGELVGYLAGHRGCGAGRAEDGGTGKDLFPHFVAPDTLYRRLGAAVGEHPLLLSPPPHDLAHMILWTSRCVME